MDAGFRGKKVSADDLLIGLLPQATSRVLEKLAGAEFMKTIDWYLAEGTALALQAGHRQSVDLDFFTERKDFDETRLERELVKIGG